MIRYLVSLIVGLSGTISIYISKYIKQGSNNMRTRKQELISDELKPLVSEMMKTAREKYKYSLEDLAKAINYQKNRQTLHKYETGKLNIPYDILFEICRVFNIDSDMFKEAPITEEEKK